MGAYQKSNHIFLDGARPREGGVSKVKLWIKDTPKLHGPVYKFEMRPRIFMDSYINMKEGQRDPETEWTRI